jgi:hypothetical protein
VVTAGSGERISWHRIRSRRRRSSLACLLIALAFTPLRAAPLVLDSGARQVSLLELYTSQGCSSCPPAERWLNDWVDDERLWRELVPVALHVDYWDYLGWRDPFATAANSRRQQAYARAGRARTVYTPGFFLNGREWRGWTLRLPPRASGSMPGSLVATVDGHRVSAAFPSDGTPLELHVAVLGFGIETPVERGENRNRTLRQEFVLLGHDMHGSQDGRWDVALPVVAGGDAERRGIALWVNAAGDARPLQATGGWLPVE